MSVPVVNLSLDKGVDFESTFSVTNSDGSVYSLLNHTASAKIKKHPSSSTYKSFSTAITVSIGQIRISMASSITDTLSVGRNYYDVIVTNSNTGRKTKVFEGSIIVNDSVTV